MIPSASPIPGSISTSAIQQKLQARLAELRAASSHNLKPTLSTAPASTTPAILSIPAHPSNTLHSYGTDKHGNTITYNTAQAKAISMIASGASCVVIGAAGTGKTTIQRGSTQALIDSGHLGKLGVGGHKHLKPASYGIAICAYTRRATNNIAKNLSQDMKDSCMTIHKLLEYEPVEHYTPEGKRTMRFEPTRNSTNPLPSTLQTIIIEEASMVSLELFQQVVDACPHNPQYVFLGDIQQLPPVFGSAILGYKMLTLPVVELTEVYRQALQSPILSLAHRILSGSPIKSSDLPSVSVQNKLTLHPWKKKISAESATITLAKFFVAAIDQGKYNPETDGILIPFNKACGTIELNKHIATRLAQRAFRPVHEIIHGWKKSYYSEGDKCLYNREDCIIKKIYPNPQYIGTNPQPADLELDYWGNLRGASTDQSTDDSDIDTFLSAVSIGAEEDDKDRKTRAASHCIQLYLLDSEQSITIKSAGEIESLDLGYAITIHKSQGSEWNKVYLCLHNSHATMLQRELLYTAVTRAKEELFCICEPDTFEKGILRQRIPGNTWQEKAKAFQGRLDSGILQA